MITDQGLFVDIQVDGGIYQTQCQRSTGCRSEYYCSRVPPVFKGDPAENPKAMMEILKTYE